MKPGFQAAGLAVLVVAACNFPGLGSRRPTFEDVMATISAVTPVATRTLPPTASPDPASIPREPRRPFPSAEPPGVPYSYSTRAGDTLEALTLRFQANPTTVESSALHPGAGFMPIGTQLRFPNVLESVSPGGDLLPDAEVVYSPAAADFDVYAFVEAAGGTLAHYSEALEDGTLLGGAAIVQRVADENSVNPRLLLAILEWRSGWVYGSLPDADAVRYPIGFRLSGRSGLYPELTVAATQLNLGYYGWRAGTMVETRAGTGETIRWNPTLNAGTVAVLRLSVLLEESAWLEAIVGRRGFRAVYEAMFADAWIREAAAGPLLPDHLVQPSLELPFAVGERWSLTAGPHNAWSYGTPRGALDFSPMTGGKPCDVSPAWVTASAPGVVVRAADNAVALDLDGDGRESTGWVLLYYHLAAEGMIPPWVRVETGDPLGHPSCEGGRATGKHVHLARKYNGEWLAADGPVPFVLGGWTAVADARNYYGSLVRGGDVVTSDSGGGRGSMIWR